MLEVLEEYFRDGKLKYVVICGHPNMDKDVVVTEYMLCVEVLGMSWEDQRVIFVVSDKKGEAYNKDGFFNYHTGKWIRFKKTETIDAASQDTEVLQVARSPLPKLQRAVVGARPRTSIHCPTGEDDDIVEVDRSQVLFFNIDTGKEFDPITEEKLRAGQRVFHYDHHPAKIDISGLDVKRIVFVCQRSLLENEQTSDIKARLLSTFDELEDFQESIELFFADDEDVLPSFGNNTLIICVNVGNKFLHFSRQSFSQGQRVFYYPEWSASGLVFRTHEDEFAASPWYEQYQLLALVTELNDMGKRFDASNEYKMGCLFTLGEALVGLNYNKVHERDVWRTVQCAFLMLEAYLSNRIMFEDNLCAVRQGRFWKLHGVRLYAHDLTNSGMTGETLRRFLGNPPFLPGKERCDVAITICADRTQIVILNRDLIDPALLDTAEIKARLSRMFPRAGQTAFKDFRSFLVGWSSREVKLEDAREIVTDLIEERKERFLDLTSGAMAWHDRIRDKLRELSKIVNPGRRRAVWKAFLESISDAIIHDLAERMFFGEISFAEESDEGGESGA